MPPTGVGRRVIRMSTLKDLLIPKRITYPDAASILEAYNLEKRISRILGSTRKTEESKAIFAELDTFIDNLIAKRSA